MRALQALVCSILLLLLLLLLLLRRRRAPYLVHPRPPMWQGSLVQAPHAVSVRHCELHTALASRRLCKNGVQ
jgi:hypothetical protein